MPADKVPLNACAGLDCCTASLERPPKASLASREPLIRQAFGLEWLTIAWMVIEAGVALWAAWTAGSVLLAAFGLDSLIELASAGVLIWRLSVELRQGKEFSETTEHAASRIAGALLLALATYVVIAAGWSLWAGGAAEFSLPGFVVALIAIPTMRYLATRKIAVAEKIGSRALRADAMEAVTCGWLSFAVVIGLAVHWAIGASWVDSVASLIIVWLLVKEGREAWAGEECGCSEGCH